MSMNVSAAESSAHTGRLTRVLETCHELLDDGDAAGAISHLAGELSRIREACTPDEWSVIADICQAHSLHRRLREDPYLADAFHKPRGYPGDAETLDFVYGYRQPGSEITRLGRELLSVTTSVGIAGAVRTRCSHIAELVRGVAPKEPSPVILSIACGHLRELHWVGGSAEDLTVVGVDHDQATLDTAVKLHQSVKLTGVRASVRSLIAGKVQLPSADLIYASGLYDYLEDPTAIALTNVLVASLRPGGRLLIANLTPNNEEIACMEAIWDWWMVYRDEDAMLCLASQLGTEYTASVYTIAGGRVACMLVRRNAE